MRNVGCPAKRAGWDGGEPPSLRRAVLPAANTSALRARSQTAPDGRHAAAERLRGRHCSYSGIAIQQERDWIRRKCNAPCAMGRFVDRHVLRRRVGLSSTGVRRFAKTCTRSCSAAGVAVEQAREETPYRPMITRASQRRDRELGPFSHRRFNGVVSHHCWKTSGVTVFAGNPGPEARHQAVLPPTNPGVR